MRLIYLKQSLEISRETMGTDALAMWNVYGANNRAFPDGTTITLESVRAIRNMGIERAAAWRMEE